MTDMTKSLRIRIIPASPFSTHDLTDPHARLRRDVRVSDVLFHQSLDEASGKGLPVAISTPGELRFDCGHLGLADGPDPTWAQAVSRDGSVARAAGHIGGDSAFLCGRQRHEDADANIFAVEL